MIRNPVRRASGSTGKIAFLERRSTEVQRCLKTTNLFNTLSLECKAGIAFGDDAVGSDLATALRYSIPMNNGRWGFVKGGYRYLTYKKKYSDIKMMETAMDGGFLEAGFIF